MDYIRLGRTGLMVSRLCLGTMNFGPQASEDDSFKIMDKALELGINFLDTANTYGWGAGDDGWDWKTNVYGGDAANVNISGLTPSLFPGQRRVS